MEKIVYVKDTKYTVQYTYKMTKYDSTMFHHLELTHRDLEEILPTVKLNWQDTDTTRVSVIAKVKELIQLHKTRPPTTPQEEFAHWNGDLEDWDE